MVILWFRYLYRYTLCSFVVRVCVATHHTTPPPHKTALHYNQAQAHTHTYTDTHTKTKTHRHSKTKTRTKGTKKPCTMHFFACWFHNPAIRELPFLFLFWMILLVYCIALYCVLLLFVYLSIYLLRVYLYMYCCCYCCFRYLNGVCPIRDGHCGHHQHTRTSTIYL